MPPRFASLLRSARSFIAVSVFCAASAFVSAQQAASRLPDVIDEQNLVTLKGNIPLQVRTQSDQGEVQGALPMQRMILVLKRTDAQEKSLKATIKNLHDPASAAYHKWLTPTAFGKQYGPSDADVAKLTAWLAGHGFQVNRVAQGRQTIEFSGTANSVAEAFHTHIHTYAADGKRHYANATNPRIPSSLTSVVSGVLSLHNFEKTPTARILGKAQLDPAKAASALASGKVRSKSDLLYKPNYSNSGTNYVGPGDLWTIYNATSLITASSSPIDGSGQTIAIVGRSDINSNDLVGFRANMLPAPFASTLPFKQIINGPDPGISDDALEQTLDVEYSSALAPGAQIDLVVSGSTNSTDGVDLSAEYIVDNNLAAVVSTSYGSCEASMGTENDFYNALWEQAAAQGITALVSSGDNGAAGCDLVGPSGSDSLGYVADEGLQVSGLASTPYNIAVGGNEFSDDTSTYWNSTSTSSPAPFTSALSYIPEKVWNESCSPLVCGNADADIAAGSGGASGCFTPTLDASGNITSCSGGYAMPDWQTGVAGLPTDNKRHLPDISLTAASHDGYMLCYENSCDSSSFYVVGGTSASSPSFAGIMALVNQKTGSRQGQANYTLYRLAGSQFGTVDAPNTAKLTACNASNGNTVDSSCIFHDVTAGTNAVPCDGGTLNCNSTVTGAYGTLTGYAAATGYDSATGLGSVNVTNLVNHWNDTTLAATATSLQLGAKQSVFGSPVTIKIAVAPKTGSGTPSGTVALLTDSTLAGAVGAGTVTLTNGGYDSTINSLPGGTYNLSARYAGDATFASSLSTGSSITVTPANSAAALAIVGYDPVTSTAVSGSSVPYGSTMQASATVSGVTGLVAPSGTVTFLSGATTLSSVTSAGDGTASYSGSGYAIGKYTWKASYAGNNNYSASTSSAVSFTVTKAATSLKLLSSTSYVVGTGTATLTAIAGDDSLLLNPTGNVTFSVNGTVAGTVAVSAYTDPSTGASFAKATFTLPASLLKAGANALTAAYDGDSNYIASSSSSVSIGYGATAAANTIALAATPTAASTGQAVTLTATVTTGGISTTAGTVNFFDGKVLLGSVQVVGDAAATGHTIGTAVFKTILKPGSHNLTATYLGILVAPDAVTSTASTVTVTGTLPSTISLAAAASSSNPVNYDLTATVTGYGFTAPAASVDFSESSVVTDLGTGSVDTTGAAQTFLTPTLTTSGDSSAYPAQSVIADFNGDGIPDIATANASFSEGTMSVLIGNGDGTFKTPVTYTAGVFASAIVAGDFNNDGVLDIAVTNQYNSSFGDGYISIYLGNGDGTFKPEIGVPIPGYAEATVAADFNRDGILDLVSLQFYPSQFSVLFGNGDGTFKDPVNYPVTSSMYSPYTLAVGDFNGDGIPDIAEANSSDNTVGIFLNSGDGTLVAKTYVASDNPQWITVADVNADGKSDLLVSNYGDETMSVLLGNGDGTFKDGVAYSLDGYAATLAVADIDGDGKLDVAAGYFYPAIGVGILKGNGDGTFGKVTDYATNQGHGFAVSLADLNGDGTPDLVNVDINSGDGSAHDIAILLNATQAKASLSNVAVAGPTTTQEVIQAVYSGNTNYNASSSAEVFVKGSGAEANPVIVWTPASPWGASVALGTNVLNATVTGNIAGAFTYTAQTGTSSAVAINSASTLAAGTYKLTATFTPVDATNYTVQTATRTVVIQPADFALESGSTSLTLTAGGSGTVTITVPALYGFTGAITLSGGNSLPGGFTVSASPATIAAGGSSTVTIQTTGLSSTASAATHQDWNGWLAGSGIALSCLLIFPIARRRKLYGAACLVLLTMLGTLNGCGGAGFSTATVSLASNSNKVASGSAVTLTATVSSHNSKPSGSVIFYNGTTVLGTATSITSGVATLSVSSLPVGLNSLTAVYTGDAHDSSATSSSLAQLITGQTTVEITGTSGAAVHSTSVAITLQ